MGWVIPQKVQIYLEYHSVCPLVRIGTLHPHFRKRVCTPTPEPKGGILAAGEGVGESQFGRLEKKPSALSTLWVIQYSM